MFWDRLFSVDFRQCPMYEKAHNNYTRLSTLEKTMKEIKDNQEGFKQTQVDQGKYLTAHMEDEAAHHNRTNDSLVLVAKTLTTLTDKYEADKEVLERRNRLKEKVLGSLFTAVALSLSYWLFDIITHLEQVNSILKGG